MSSSVSIAVDAGVVVVVTGVHGATKYPPTFLVYYSRTKQDGKLSRRPLYDRIVEEGAKSTAHSLSSGDHNDWVGSLTCDEIGYVRTIKDRQDVFCTQTCHSDIDIDN